jgi:predicted transport protein
VVRYVALLSRDAVIGGRLDSLGSRLFDEARIRKALEELFNEAPNRFVSLIRQQLPEGERTLTPAEIRDVLKRVGKGLLPTAALPQAVAVAATVNATPAKPSRRKSERPPANKATGKRGEREYTFQEHFGDKPQVIVDLYTQLHERLLALDGQVERIFRKQYVGYRLGKRVFCSVIPQKHRLRLVLPIEPSAVAGQARTRDVSKVGHWGIGQTEVSLDGEDQLDDTMDFVAQAITAVSQH